VTPSAKAAALVCWYRAHARPLPWRDDPQPYHILLSELLCQQTRIATALPYYERFLAAWPTLADLAAASEDEVLRAWAGLGYYRRARALHAAAREATAAGGLPDTVEGLRQLPGIGPYTAGAIASIAFGRRAPAVDGNVERVISRVHRGPEAPWRAAGKRALRARVQQLHDALAPGHTPGELTQALMELGATVCSVSTPRCGECPVAEGCEARKAGEVDQWPRRRPRKPPTPIRAVAGLAFVDGLPLLARRPAHGLLGGLWEPVGGPLTDEAAPRQALVDGFRERAGLTAEIERPLGTVTHVFSHRHLTLQVFAVRVDGQPQARAFYDEVGPRDPESVGLSKLARKALALGEAPPLLLAADGPREA